MNFIVCHSDVNRECLINLDMVSSIFDYNEKAEIFFTDEDDYMSTSESYEEIKELVYDAIAQEKRRCDR